MEQVIGLLIQVFFLVFLGMLMRKKGLLTNEVQAKLSRLITRFILPFSILASSDRAFDSAMGKGLLLSVLFIVLYFSLATLINYRLGKRIYPDQLKQAGLFANCATFANVGFLGFPVISTLLGNDGMIYAVLYNMVFNLFYYTLGLSFISPKGHKPRKKFVELLTDPAIMSSIVTILVFVSPFRFPPLAYKTFRMIGDMLTPFTMFLIGASLIGIRFKDIFTGKIPYLISFLRLVFYPALMYIAFLSFPEHKMAFATLVLLTSLPVGSLNNIFAQVYKLDVDLVTKATIQSMLLMIISLPIWLMLVL